jgi:hypothetical protein
LAPAVQIKFNIREVQMHREFEATGAKPEDMPPLAEAMLRILNAFPQAHPGGSGVNGFDLPGGASHLTVEINGRSIGILVYEPRPFQAATNVARLEEVRQ